MHDTAPRPDHSKAPDTGKCAHHDAHLACEHLHDREHIHHLWIATLILALNIAMTIGVPFLAVQLLVTIGLFGRDAIDILLS